MLLTGHKSRAIFDRYNIINEQELLEAGDQLVEYLTQQARTPRGRAHPTGAAAPPPRATHYRVRARTQAQRDRRPTSPAIGRGGLLDGSEQVTVEEPDDPSLEFRGPVVEERDVTEVGVARRVD